MWPYLFVFSISILSTQIATIGINRNNKVVFYCFSIIALSFPILLAAFRDDRIGTDMQSYVMDYFEAIRSCRGDYLNSMEIIRLTHYGQDTEYLYKVLNYLCCLVSNDIHFFLGILETCIIVPIYVCSIRMRHLVAPSYVMFMFYCILYNESLNMVRQSLALGIVMLSMAYLLNRQYWKHILCCFIACWLHTSAILSFFLLPIFFFAKRFSLKENKGIYVGFIISLILVPFFFAAIIVHFISLDVINVKYIVYVEEVLFEAGISKSVMIIKLSELFLLYLVIRKIKRSKEEIDFFFLCALINVVLGLMGLIVSFLSRISWYFEIVSFLSVAYCFYSPNRCIGKSRLLLKHIYTILFIFYWYFGFILSGMSDTYPYSSTILGI